MRVVLTVWLQEGWATVGGTIPKQGTWIVSGIEMSMGQQARTEPRELVSKQQPSWLPPLGICLPGAKTRGKTRATGPQG